MSPAMPRSPRPVSSYLALARRLGDRLHAAVRPIRVLNAVRWDGSAEKAFLASGGRVLPPVTAESYRPLPFDPAEKRRELNDIARDVLTRLGRGDPFARLVVRRCRQACATVDMLRQRGRPAFAALAREAYGQPTPAEDAAVATVFPALAAIVPAAPPRDEPRMHATEAVESLANRLRRSFGMADGFVVRVADDLASQAAARGRSIRIRRDACFAKADVASLEAHEGWVHIGTTLNARRQPACRFLPHSLPHATSTQEGLAVLCELLAGVCHADRIRRLARRYQAVRMADDGADFRDVFRLFLSDSDDRRDACRQAARVFRGSLPAGAGPFPKDRMYALGLVQLLRAAHSAIRRDRLGQFGLLFAGKVGLADLPLLESLAEAGVLKSSGFLPPPLRDRATLADRLRTLPHPPHRLPPPHIPEKSLRFSGNRPARPLFLEGDDPSDLRATG